MSGGIVFSRLRYEQDNRTVFVLAPVAVATDQQGKGIGQRLLIHGLASLRSAGVDIVMTYGDPNYYAKVGFVPISEADAQGGRGRETRGEGDERDAGRTGAREAQAVGGNGRKTKAQGRRDGGEEGEHEAGTREQRA